MSTNVSGCAGVAMAANISRWIGKCGNGCKLHELDRWNDGYELQLLGWRVTG